MIRWGRKHKNSESNLEMDQKENNDNNNTLNAMCPFLLIRHWILPGDIHKSKKVSIYYTVIVVLRDNSRNTLTMKSI